MVFSSLLKVVRHCDKLPYGPIDAVLFEHQGVSLGHILPDVFNALKVYQPSPFDIQPDRVSFASWVDTFDKRTEAVKSLMDHWREQKAFAALAGWRNELYPVYGNNEILFVMERAAASLLGISTFAKRSKTKQTWPGMLDNCVAGGISYKHNIKETVIKECDEEASIPFELASKAHSATAITYHTFSQNGLQPETQYIYDLELPQDFKPTPRDGEVECFYLWPLDKVKESILNEQWKPNCAAGKSLVKGHMTKIIVMIEFMLRHGFITPDDEPGYIQISYHLHRRLEFPTPTQ
ncbi:unnamed protein product [Rhizopus stolonifer]